MHGATELTDSAVRAAAGGEREKLARIMEACEPQVRAMVMVRLAPTPAQIHLADEITQQSLEALTHGIPRLEKITVAGLKAFLSGIVTRKVSDVLRRIGRARNARHQIHSLDSTVATSTVAGPLWQFLPQSGTSPPSAVARAELNQRLMSELGHLKSTYREVITLAFFDQLPMAEIAQRMDTTRPAASMLLIRAIQTLRRSMCTPSRVE